MWTASYLRGEIFVKFELYIAHYLERGNVASCDLIITKIMNTVGYYLKFLL
jgi:hypothetical protein